MTKKLTVKSIRQGQTVYCVATSAFGRGVSTGKALVMNDNAPEVNYKTSWLKNVASFMVSSDNFFVTYSRRKAIRKAKELNRMMKVV